MGWKIGLALLSIWFLLGCTTVQQQLDTSLALDAPTDVAPIQPSDAVISAEIVATLRQTEPIGLGIPSTVAYSPDGSRIAVGSSNGLYIYTHELELITHPDQFGWYIDIAYSPDGSLLAAAERHLGEVHIWNTSDWTLVYTIELDTQALAVAYSPDGSRLATGDHSGQLHIWRSADLSQPFYSEQFASAIQTIAYSHMENYFAIGLAEPNDKTQSVIKLWDLNNAEAPLWESEASDAAVLTNVQSLSFTPDGQYLASASRYAVDIWNSHDGTYVDSFQQSGYVNALSFSPSSGYLAGVDDAAQITLQSRQAGSSLARLSDGGHPIESIAFAPDEQTLVVGHQDGALRVWDIASQSVRHSQHGRFGIVTDMAVAPNDSQVAVAERLGQVTAWDLPTRRWLFSFNHGEWINDITYSPDGSLIASAGDDGQIKLWRSADGGLQQTFDTGTETVEALAFAPDGAWIVSGDSDQHLTIWDVETGLILFQFHHTAWVTTVAVSADQTLLASSGTDGQIRVWRIADGVEAYTIDAHSDNVHTLAFSADSERLASGSDDTTLGLWRASDGVAIGRFGDHNSSIEQVAFSADSQLLVSASTDGSLIVWDMANNTFLRRLWGQWAPRAVTFSTDQTQIIAGAEDAMIRFWKIGSNGSE